MFVHISIREYTPEAQAHQIRLNQNTLLAVTPESLFFDELLLAISNCDPSFPIEIHSENVMISSDFEQFLQGLNEQKFSGLIVLKQDDSNDTNAFYNTALLNLHLYNRRKQAQPVIVPVQSAQPRLPVDSQQQVRRSKLALLNGQRLPMPTQYQHQHQHQQEHAVQQAEQTQQQQQQQQQQFQTRQNQIQQQQQRMQALQREQSLVPEEDLRHLIHQDNLQVLVEESGLSLDKLTLFWNQVVGLHANQVDSPHHRITHIPKNTLLLILQYPWEWRYGIELMDLPNGFGFAVHETQVDGISVSQSILYYDKRLVRSLDDRKDSPLSATCVKQAPLIITGDVGQLYPFAINRPFNETHYRSFVQAYQLDFNHLFDKTKRCSFRQKKQSFIRLMQLEQPAFDISQLTAVIDLSEHLLQGLCSILITSGTDGIASLLHNLNRLKQVQEYDLFKELFLDRSTDWRHLVRTQTLRPTDLNAWQCFDYVCTMPLEQRNWWQALLLQHAKANPETLDMLSLVNAQYYFFNQVTTIDNELHLPLTCPIENILNMKTAYARLLYLLKKAIDPVAQCNHLDGLDFGPQGVICAAYQENYVFFSKHMNLTPNSIEFNWENYRRYAPQPITTQDFNVKLWCGSTPYKGNNPIFEPNSQKQFAQPPVRKIFFSSFETTDAPFFQVTLYRNEATGLVSYRVIEAPENEPLFPPGTIELEPTISQLTIPKLVIGSMTTAYVAPGVYTDDFLDTVDPDRFEGLVLRLIPGRIPDDEEIKLHRIYLYLNKTEIYLALRQRASLRQRAFGDMSVRREKLSMHNSEAQRLFSMLQTFVRNDGTLYSEFCLRAEIPFCYDAAMHQAIINLLSVETTSLEPHPNQMSAITDYLSPFIENITLDKRRLLGSTPEQWISKIQDYVINDPMLQDDSIKTNSKTLAYGTDLEKLVLLSRQLSFFDNMIAYFYRRLGQESFILPFQLYDRLLTQLRQAPFNQKVLRLNLLPLLAITTTGVRACEQNCNVLEDLAGLVHLLQQHESKGLELLKHFNVKYIYIVPRPTVYEFTALAKLSFKFGQLSYFQVIDFPQRTDFIRALMQAVLNYGPSVYQAIVYVSQRQDEWTVTQLMSFATLLGLMPGGFDGRKSSLMVLLISLIQTNELQQITKYELSEKINTTDCSELTTLLETVSVAGSTQFISVDAMMALLTELSCIAPDEPARESLVLMLAKKYLPGLKFKDASVASSIAGLIRKMAPWVVAIDELLEQLPDDPITLLPENLTDVYKKTQQLDRSSPVAGHLLAYLNEIKQELTTLKNLIKQATDEGATDVFKAILRTVQNVVDRLENPLHDLSGVQGFALRAMLAPIIALIKPKIVEMVSEHTVGVLRLSISQEVLQLTIRDSVLNEPQEQAILLSTCLSEFLMQQIPALSGEQLALEINRAYQAHETIEGLLHVLKQMAQRTTRTRRDELIAFLYRQGYFQGNFSAISLRDLTVLIQLIAAKSTIDSVDCFRIVFDAISKGLAVTRIQAVLELLMQSNDVLSNAQFQTLFELGLYHLDQTSLRALLKLRLMFQMASKPDAFADLLSFVAAFPQASWAELLPNLLNLLQNTPNSCIKMADYLKQLTPASLEAIQSLKDWLSWFDNHEFNEHREDIMTLLHATVWSRLGDTTSLLKQKKLIEQLLSVPATLSKLARLYEKRPNPSFNALQQAVNTPNFNVDDFINHYELDPFGHRIHVKKQWNTVGVDTFCAEIADLQTGQPLSAQAQRELANDIAYIIGIGSRLALPIGNKVKPIAAFTRDELTAHLQRLCNNKPVDHTTQLQILAILCEVMFRTTGKYPYYTQIASVLLSVNSSGNVLQEIPTGQGKSTTIALTAAMTHLLSCPKVWTTVCSRNTFLTGRDYQQSLDFYNYVGIETAWVKAGTQDNHYACEPKIIYTTPADLSLYRSKLTIVDKIIWPDCDQHVVIADEVDGDLFDNENAFNFSHSSEDPFTNPLEWLYPLANDYIDSPQFLDTRVLEQEDIVLFRRFIKTTAPEKYRQQLSRLSDYKLNLLLEAACIAKPLQEKEHFLVRTKARLVHGATKTNSFAHLLIHHVEDTDATLCHGAQQCLHDRLNRKYASQIAAGTMPAFPCDNEVDCVDTQNSHRFFSWFGRFLGYTGTAGTLKELYEASTRFVFANLLKIPPRKRGTLHTLATIFTDEQASFFFDRETQINAIKRAIRKAPNQPILIAVESIEKADRMYAALSQAFPSRVGVIHAENADNPEDFEEQVRLAGVPGRITIVTPLATRGTDFKIMASLAANSSTLLVIETFLDRYRNRRQLIGRTARDGNPGETLGIFDLSDIETTFGVSLRGLSSDEKLKKLTQLMDKMDNEACVEREIKLAVEQLIQDYGSIFDQWLQQSQDSLQQEGLLRAKAQWIQTSQQVWQTLLTQSDPAGQYAANPYLRYDQNGVLDNTVLRELIGTFADILKEKTFPACKQTIALDGLSHEPLIATPAFINPLTPIDLVQATDRPIVVANTAAAYLTKHGKINENCLNHTNGAHERYLADLEKQYQYETRLNYWLTQCSLPESMKAFLQTQAIQMLDNLPNGRVDDLVLQAQQLHYLLEYTKARLNTTWYRLTHPFAEQKIKVLERRLIDCRNFIEGSISEEEYFPTDNSKRIQLNVLIKHCHDCFSMNTSWGGMAFTDTTCSMNDCKQWEFLSSKVFSKTRLDRQGYLQELDTIKANLAKRSCQAGFFKDKTHYQQKVETLERLQDYLQKNVPGSALLQESMLYDVQTRMEQDQLLHKNTNRFFHLSGNVTLTEAISGLQKKL